MYTNQPTTMIVVRQLMAEDLQREAVRERLARQALATMPERAHRWTGVGLMLEAVVDWIGGRLRGAGVSERAAAPVSGSAI
jgi:hypothetical protein